MAARPRILLTNDDGIAAVGLAALEEALRDVADLSILAPDHNWSAAGHNKTMHKPLRVWPAALHNGAPAMATSGSPSDCVALALLGLCETRPGLVVSGINSGANVGDDLTYSGTVAAAMESVISGIPAIAVSVDDHGATEDHTRAGLASAASFVRSLVVHMQGMATRGNMLLNINVPALPEREIAGVKVTRLGKRLYRDTLVERKDPRGRKYYWIGGDPPTGLAEPGTDIGALAQGCISVTPILLDLTDYAAMAELQMWGLSFPGPS